MNLKKLEVYKDLESLTLVTVAQNELIEAQTNDFEDLMVKAQEMGFKTTLLINKQVADYAIDNSISTIGLMTECEADTLSQDVLDRINILKYSELKD